MENSTSAIDRHLKQIAQNHENLNTMLVYFKEEPLNEDSQAHILSKVLGSRLDTDVDQEVSENLTKLIRYADHIIMESIRVNSAIDLEKEDVEASIYRQRKQAKAQRKDDWLAWIAKAFRWTLGVVLALFLYSLAVYLSDVTCVKSSDEAEFCVHVPVKDWFAPQKE